MTGRKYGWLIAALCIWIVLAACGKTEGEKGAGKPEPDVEEIEGAATHKRLTDPVTIHVHWPAAAPEEQFNERYGNALREQFPHVTLEYLFAERGRHIPDLLTAGTPIDIIIGLLSSFEADIRQYGFQYDLTPLIRQYNLDIGRYRSSSIDEIAAVSDGGLYGLPVTTMSMIMYYNEELFDRFGAPYPTDGMTWEEALNLARRVTRMEDGSPYRGFYLSTIHYFRYNPFSIPLVDPATDRANFNNDIFAKMYDWLLVRPYAIPGNEPLKASELTSVGGMNTVFAGDRTLAMWATNSNRHDYFPEDFTQWDVAAMPTFPEAQGIGAQQFSTFFYVTSISEHKEQAFEMIQYLGSLEHQLDISRKGMEPVLNDPQVQAAFGQGTAWRDKNVGAFFFNTPAPSAQMSPYLTIVQNEYQKPFFDLATGKIDVNTAIRLGEEAANQAVTSQKLK